MPHRLFCSGHSNRDPHENPWYRCLFSSCLTKTRRTPPPRPGSCLVIGHSPLTLPSISLSSPRTLLLAFSVARRLQPPSTHPLPPIQTGFLPVELLRWGSLGRQSPPQWLFMLRISAMRFDGFLNRLNTPALPASLLCTTKLRSTRPSQRARISLHCATYQVTFYRL